MGEETDFGNYYTTTYSVPDKITLNARILNEKCVLNKEIDVEITSHYPLTSYTYFIVSRSKILESKTVSVAKTADSPDVSLHTHRFTFLPTFDYAPRATIIIYYMKDDQLVSANVCAEMYDDFKNFVELDVGSTTAKPGQTIELRVKSNRNATIGLLGYDKSLSILRSGNDLTRDDIWNELEMFSSRVKHREYDYVNFDSPSKKPIYYNPWSDFSVSCLRIITLIL